MEDSTATVQPVRMLSDSELIHEIRHRNVDAFQELQDRYAPGVRAYACREACSQAEADFVVERVFYRIWNGLSPFRVHRYHIVHSWVYAVARRTCREFFSARRRRGAGAARPAASH